MIMFTGSTRTGRKVAMAAAERLIPCSLELGGKDPMIVLRDADLERAANVATYYAMLNGGQTCISIERVYVEEPVYDEFVAKVTEKVRALRQGRSVGPGTVGRRLDDLPAADGHRRRPRAGRRRQGRQGARRRPQARGRGHLLRAHRAGRRRPHDGGDDRGDLRPDAADHEGARRRGGDAPGQRLRRTGSADRSSPRTSAAASSSPSASRPAPSASTTRSSTTRRSSCRWAARRRPASAARHGPDGIRKFCQQQSIMVSRNFPKRELHMYPYTAKNTKRIGKVLGFLYGRGSKD